MTGARTLLVSATDARFFPLLQSMLATLDPPRNFPDMDFLCLDIGMDEHQRDLLRRGGARVEPPRAHFGVDPAAHSPHLLSFLARPFLPQDFPGYDLYVWVDSDVWFQSPAALTRYLDGAAEQGFAIAHESERGYRFQSYLFAWTSKHFLLGYGLFTGAWLISRRHFNAGMFAGRADAPHWARWADLYGAAIRRSGKLVPHDQFALVQALHAESGRARLATRILDPTCNWIVDRGPPMWNDELGVFCRPYAPFEPIAALHLAGPGKKGVYDVRRTGGGSFKTSILPGASPERGVIAALQPEDAAAALASIPM